MVKKLLVIPAHNEVKTILGVLGKAKELDGWETLMIDCASTDNTLEVAREKYHDLKYVSTNIKGLAINLVNAFYIGIINNYDFIATCDADAEYDVSEIQKLYEVMQPDVFCVLGNRFKQESPIKDKVISQVVKDLYGTDITDCKSGQRIYCTKKLVDVLHFPFNSTHYGLSLELVMKGLQQKQIIIEHNLDHYEKKRERILLTVNKENKEVIDLMKILGNGIISEGQTRLFKACLKLDINFEYWKAEFNKGTEYLTDRLYDR